MDMDQVRRHSTLHFSRVWRVSPRLQVITEAYNILNETVNEMNADTMKHPTATIGWM